LRISRRGYHALALTAPQTKLPLKFEILRLGRQHKQAALHFGRAKVPAERVSR
jgi:hypothetical protein